MLPASTWRAPIHSTSVIALNTDVVPSAVSQPCKRLRFTPTANECSTASLKRCVCKGSRLNDLHGLHGVDGLAGERARVGDAILRIARQPPQLPPEHDQRADDDRHQQDDHQGQRRARVDEHDERPEQRQHRAQRDRDADTGDRLHERRIGRQPRQDFARPRDLEERRVHANDFCVHGVAHVRDDALAEPSHEIEPQRRKHAEHDGRSEKEDEVPVDRGRVAHGQPFVDEVADRDRQRELRDRGDQLTPPTRARARASAAR